MVFATDIGKPSESAPPRDASELRQVYRLEGTLGIGPDHKAAPAFFDLDGDTYELAFAFRRASKQSLPLLLQESDGSLPSDLFDGVQWRGHGTKCKTAVLCAIRASTKPTVIGFLLIALNPHRPYNAVYQDFVRFLTSQVIVSHAANHVLREEVDAGKLAVQAVALERTRLSEELAAKKAEFERAEPTLVKFADLLQMGIGISDGEGRYLYANAVYRRYVGLPEGSTEAFAFMKSIIPEDEELGWKMLKELKEGRVATDVMRLRRPWTAPNGQQHPTSCLVTAFPEMGTDDDGLTLVSTVTDVSALKWAEDQLRQRTTEVEQSEMRYRKFAESAPVGVAVFCEDRLVQFSNASFIRIMAPPLPSGDILDCIHPEDAEMFAKSLADLSDTNRYVTFECRLKKRSSPNALLPFESLSTDLPTWILTSAYLEISTGTHMTCWVTDITTQKAAQDVIRRRMDQALEMKRQRERFIDMTSHEIRNPLSAMIHCIEEIIDNSKTNPAALVEETLEAANTIDYCVKHIRNIVGDVLTLSKLDSKLLSICPVPVQPDELIRDNLKMFTGEARAVGIDLRYIQDQSIAELAVDWLALDPNRLLQVLVNLVTNALKFTRTRPERRVTVRLGASTEPPTKCPEGVSYVPSKFCQSVPFTDALKIEQSLYLIVTVEDTGTGLGDEEKKVLFQRFKQASPKTETQYGGSGLGLFICRDLTELQGGGIGVMSEQGVGSKFVFFVEAKRIDAPETPQSFQLPQSFVPLWKESPDTKLPTDLTSPANSTGRNGVQAQSAQAKKAKKILIVEDNAINASLLSKQLRKRGYEIAVAVHGEEALKLLRSTTPWLTSTDKADPAFDLVLMDMSMPVMDGTTCTKEIRLLESRGRLHTRLPIIAVTANARDELMQDALDAGANAITTKPYKIGDLLTLIEEFL